MRKKITLSLTIISFLFILISCGEFKELPGDNTDGTDNTIPIAKTKTEIIIDSLRKMVITMPKSLAAADSRTETRAALDLTGNQAIKANSWFVINNFFTDYFIFNSYCPLLLAFLQNNTTEENTVYNLGTQTIATMRVFEGDPPEREREMDVGNFYWQSGTDNKIYIYWSLNYKCAYTDANGNPLYIPLCIYAVITPNDSESGITYKSEFQMKMDEALFPQAAELNFLYATDYNEATNYANLFVSMRGNDTYCRVKYISGSSTNAIQFRTGGNTREHETCCWADDNEGGVFTIYDSHDGFTEFDYELYDNNGDLLMCKEGYKELAYYYSKFTGSIINLYPDLQNPPANIWEYRDSNTNTYWYSTDQGATYKDSTFTQYPTIIWKQSDEGAIGDIFYSRSDSFTDSNTHNTVDICTPVTTIPQPYTYNNINYYIVNNTYPFNQRLQMSNGCTINVSDNSTPSNYYDDVWWIDKDNDDTFDQLWKGIGDINEEKFIFNNDMIVYKRDAVTKLFATVRNKTFSITTTLPPDITFTGNALVKTLMDRIMAAYSDPAMLDKDSAPYRDKIFPAYSLFPSR